MSDSGLLDVELWHLDDSENLTKIDEEVCMIFQCIVAAKNSYHLFNANEQLEGGVQSVNPNQGVHDLLGR